MYDSKDIRRILFGQIRTLNRSIGRPQREQRPEQLSEEKQESLCPNNVRRVYHF